MAGESVQIDLDEVQTAAKAIAGLLDELNGPMNQLEAKVKQVQKSVYGTDLLGKSLGGGSSSVGGLGEHQTQVLEGIRAFLQNAAAVAANLQAMAGRYRSVDEDHAADLRRIGSDGGSTTAPGTQSAPGPVVPPLGPVVPPLGPVTPLGPVIPPLGPVGGPAPDPGIGYHDPGAPTLDYNTPPPPEPRPGGGPGGRNLI